MDPATVETESTCAAPSEASAEAGASSEDASTVSAPRPEPVACIVIGMVGSGKTTLMQGLDAFSHTDGRKSYLINLDPAVLEVPFNASIDIRDTHNTTNTKHTTHNTQHTKHKKTHTTIHTHT